MLVDLSAKESSRVHQGLEMSVVVLRRGANVAEMDVPSTVKLEFFRAVFFVEIVQIVWELRLGQIF